MVQKPEQYKNKNNHVNIREPPRNPENHLRQSVGDRRTAASDQATQKYVGHVFGQHVAHQGAGLPSEGGEGVREVRKVDRKGAEGQ